MMSSREGWPEWWHFELVFSPHALERMQERGLGEVKLRTLLQDAQDYRPSCVPGRFLVSSSMGGDHWEVIVEPDELEGVLIVVTAYGVQSR